MTVINEKTRVLFLFLTYGDQYKAAIDKFMDMCRGIRSEKRLIIIRNERTGEELKRVDDWIYEIPGDNSCYEFSGWQKAINSDVGFSFDPEVYVFANSAFIAKKFYTLPVLDDNILKMIRENKVFGGHKRYFSFKARYSGSDLSPYISTHFFMANREIIEKLGNMVSERSTRDLVSPDPAQGIFSKDEVWNSSFKKYITVSLTQKYHEKGMKVSPEYHEFFKRKILGIITNTSV